VDLPSGIYFYDGTDSCDIALCRKVLTRCLGRMGLSNSFLDVSFLTKQEIQELNNRFRSKDSPTDVLSFPQTEFSEPVGCSNPYVSDKHVHLGDILVSVDVAKENADRIGQSLGREVCFLLVHGLLHLCGHDHEEKNQEELMCAQQRLIMEDLESQFDLSRLVNEHGS
jgi:probable rRNA maturation factor